MLFVRFCHFLVHLKNSNNENNKKKCIRLDTVDFVTFIETFIVSRCLAAHSRYDVSRCPWTQRQWKTSGVAKTISSWKCITAQQDKAKHCRSALMQKIYNVQLMAWNTQPTVWSFNVFLWCADSLFFMTENQWMGLTKTTHSQGDIHSVFLNWRQMFSGAFCTAVYRRSLSTWNTWAALSLFLARNNPCTHLHSEGDEEI